MKVQRVAKKKKKKVTRKVVRKVAARKKTPVKSKRKSSVQEWTSAQMSLFERGKPRPQSVLSIGKGIISIYRSPGRSYWVLSNIPKSEWPNFRWSDRALSFSVNSTRIVFKSAIAYANAKEAFEANQSHSMKLMSLK